MIWKIYLSGEIHTPWRDEIIESQKTISFLYLFLHRNLIMKKVMPPVIFLQRRQATFGEIIKVLRLIR